MTVILNKEVISTKHIVWASIIIGFIFTYVGVEQDLAEVITHFDFILNLVFNTIEAYALLRLAYYLNFTRKLNFWFTLAITLMVFYFVEFVSFQLTDYDSKDRTELFTSTLPFGSILIVGFNLVYSLLGKPLNKNEQVENSHIWLDTISGRVKIEESAVLFAFLNDAYLEITTTNGVLKTFYSLKQFESLLLDKDSFRRLNKQSLCQKKAIKLYRSLPDGRLEIQFDGAKKSIVSKNKASQFKVWISET